MDGVAIFLFYAVITLFAFFVVAPCILNAVSTFGGQKEFAQRMIQEGVVSEETVKMLQPKKQIAGVVISLVVLGALAWCSWRVAPMGYLCAGIGLAVGFLRYRNITQYNSLTVQRFRNTYKLHMDEKKYNRFVETNF